MQDMEKQRKNQTARGNMEGSRGFILITSYILLSALSIASFAMFSRGNAFLRASERSQNKIVAFNMAEAGIDLAIANLAEDPAYEGTPGYVSLATDTVLGGYEVSVTIPKAFPNVRLVQATGYAPDNDLAARAYETRSINAHVQIAGESLFDFAVFAEAGMQLNGNVMIDSYDSRNGPYGADNVNSNGDIGTDSTGDHTVMLAGNVVVNGDAEVGAGGDPDSVIVSSGRSTINGNETSASEPKDYDSPTTSEVSLGDLSLSGKTNYQLQGGTYRYDSLSISGQAQLSALGPVEIYVDGAVNISGQGISTSGDSPPNLLLYVTGTDDVRISGQGTFYGGIFAPRSTVRNSGQGDVYGAIVSNHYHQNGNAAIHYDEALNDIESESGDTINLTSWQEENTTAWVA